MVRLQEAFMKYSSDIQRAAILKRANNPHIAGLDRYHALRKLFDVPMASSSEVSGVTDEDVTKYHYKKFNETSKMVREGQPILSAQTTEHLFYFYSLLQYTSSLSAVHTLALV